MTYPEPPAPRWPLYVTAAAAVVAAIAAVWAAAFSSMLIGGIGQGLSAGTRPLHQVVCTAYSDFVMTQAHNGYTADQIEKVLEFAASHKPPDQTITMTPPSVSATNTPPAGVPQSTPTPSTMVIPGDLHEDGPLITDEKMCGTPAQILAAAGGPAKPR